MSMFKPLSTFEPMRPFFISPVPITFSILALAAAFSVGCSDAGLTGAELETTLSSPSPNGAVTARRLFTGRDSFGVALNAKIAGTVQQDRGSNCWILDGNGQVTHLGRTTVTKHTACLDESADPTTVVGEFIYEGMTGGSMKGEYEGTLQQGVLKADVTLNQVTNVQAVKQESEQTPPGKGTMTGTLTEQSFRYTIEGWLFQRTR